MKSIIPNGGIAFDSTAIAAAFAAIGFKLELHTVHGITGGDHDRSQVSWRGPSGKLVIKDGEDGPVLITHDPDFLTTNLYFAADGTGRLEKTESMVSRSMLSKLKPEHGLLYALGAITLRERLLDWIKEGKPFSMAPVAPMSIRHVYSEKPSPRQTGEQLRIPDGKIALLAALAQLGHTPYREGQEVRVPRFVQHGPIRFDAVHIAHDWNGGRPNNKLKALAPEHPFLYSVAGLSRYLDMRRRSARQERFIVRRKKGGIKQQRAYVPSLENKLLDKWSRENPGK